MSRSNNTELITPCQRFFDWNGDKGLLKYYDKTAVNPTNPEKTGLNIEIKLPFTFIVLDILSTITGFSDTDNSGFWSNEIRDIKKEIFIVRNKKGKVFEGNYDALKAANISGIKYAQSVYIAFKNENEMIIGNIKMVGSSLGSWIDFRKKHDVYKGAISIKSTLEGKKGKTVYQMPVFTPIQISDDSNQIAIDLDKELQEYLTAYFNKSKIDKNEESVIETMVNESVKEAFGLPEDLFIDDEPKSMKETIMNRNIIDDSSLNLPF